MSDVITTRKAARPRHTRRVIRSIDNGGATGSGQHGLRTQLSSLRNVRRHVLLDLETAAPRLKVSAYRLMRMIIAYELPHVRDGEQILLREADMATLQRRIEEIHEAQLQALIRMAQESVEHEYFVKHGLV